MPFEIEFSVENRRVLMLYGPPGTGKSTMARVLAAQSGFNPKSINASDVRSG
jgi:chromosome transmission fidelity protein 18